MEVYFPKFGDRNATVYTFTVEYKGHLTVFNVNDHTRIGSCVNHMDDKYDINDTCNGYLMCGGAPIVDLTLPAAKFNNERLVYVLY